MGWINWTYWVSFVSANLTLTVSLPLTWIIVASRHGLAIGSPLWQSRQLGRDWTAKQVDEVSDREKNRFNFRSFSGFCSIFCSDFISESYHTTQSIWSQHYEKATTRLGAHRYQIVEIKVIKYEENADHICFSHSKSQWKKTSIRSFSPLISQIVHPPKRVANSDFRGLVISWKFTRMGWYFFTFLNKIIIESEVFTRSILSSLFSLSSLSLSLALFLSWNIANHWDNFSDRLIRTKNSSKMRNEQTNRFIAFLTSKTLSNTKLLAFELQKNLN